MPSKATFLNAAGAHDVYEDRTRIGELGEVCAEVDPGVYAMEDVRNLHRRAVEAFTEAVAGVGEDDWGRDTPCVGWTVRDLVNHVVAEELWVEPLVSGETVGSVGDRFDGDVLGSAPLESARTSAKEAVRASIAVGLDQIVHLSFGDFPVSFYLEQLFADHVVHAWDLCVAAGIPYTVDEDLIVACAEWFASQEAAYRAAGAIAERPRDLPAAGNLQRLLVMFGRDPDWQPLP